MELYLDTKLASQYKSPSQRIRILTEAWVDSQIFCPSCGRDIIKYKNNKPAADFYCRGCAEEFELKSKKENTFKKIVDGAYGKMIEKLKNNHAPNLFLLNYSALNLEVLNFFVVPKHFFIPEMIEKRKPLSLKAERAGWVGCNILLQNIPQSGKIFFVREGNIKAKKEVLKIWTKTLFLREEKEAKTRGWILDVMNCVDRFAKREFSLNEVYNFEHELKLKHPNEHVKGNGAIPQSATLRSAVGSEEGVKSGFSS